MFLPCCNVFHCSLWQKKHG